MTESVLETSADLYQGFVYLLKLECEHLEVKMVSFILFCSQCPDTPSK